MLRFNSNLALGIYAGAVTLALCWSKVAASQPETTLVDTLDVHRINVREDDGTIRMIIASKDHSPGYIIDNKPVQGPTRPTAGIVFYNDDGSERGGLEYSGKMIGGAPTTSAELGFDQFGQNEVVALTQDQSDAGRSGGLMIADRPDAPVVPAAVAAWSLPPDEQAGALAHLCDNGACGRTRLYVGTSTNRDAVVALRDGEGRVRLQMRVTEAGLPVIEFLDTQGRVVKTEGVE